MSAEDTTRRLARLEQQLARQRRVTLALALVLVASFVLAATRRTPEVLEARELRLLDGAGEVGLRADAAGLQIVTAEPADAPRAAGTEAPVPAPAESSRRTALSAAGLVVTHRRGGVVEHVLELRPREVDLIDYVTRSRAVIQPRLVGLQNGIVDADSPVVGWSTLRHGVLQLEDAEGTPRARVGLSSQDELPTASAELFDAAGAPTWHAP